MSLLVSEPKVFYLDQRGRRVKRLWKDIPDLPLTTLMPVRTPASYRMQRHLPGRYWFSTTGEHVIYESRMELKTLMVLNTH